MASIVEAPIVTQEPAIAPQSRLQRAKNFVFTHAFMLQATAITACVAGVARANEDSYIQQLPESEKAIASSMGHPVIGAIAVLGCVTSGTDKLSAPRRYAAYGAVTVGGDVAVEQLQDMFLHHDHPWFNPANWGENGKDLGFAIAGAFYFAYLHRKNPLS